MAVLNLAWEPKPPPLPWYASAAGQTGITVATVLAIASIVGIGTAVGQTATDATPALPLARFLERFTGQPATSVTPLDRSQKGDAAPPRMLPRLSTVEDITGIKQGPPLYQASTTPPTALFSGPK